MLTIGKYTLFLVLYILLSVFYFAVPILKGELIVPGDSLVQYYPLRLFYSLSHYLDLLWLPYQFLGLPFLGTLQTGLLYPLNFLYFLIPAPFVFNFNIILHYALAAFFTFLYARLLGVRVFPAFMAGLVFGFSGFLMAHKGHISMVNAAVWLPLL
ncbi:MAG: YfhO family protein, partial [Armatimonadetes bacterium]|nr:YfhO family protein [Armatimonadota bacterium]